MRSHFCFLVECILEDFELEEKKKSKVKTGDDGKSTSEQEDMMYERLKELFPGQKIYRNWKEAELYPWKADFYIPDEKLILEYEKHITHGRRRFEGTPEDLEDLKWLESFDNDFYRRIIDTWTVKDPEKLKTAEENGFRHETFYNMEEFDKWAENTNLTYDEYKAPHPLQYDSDEYWRRKELDLENPWGNTHTTDWYDEEGNKREKEDEESQE
jgi:hypothetical protein